MVIIFQKQEFNQINPSVLDDTVYAYFSKGKKMNNYLRSVFSKIMRINSRIFCSRYQELERRPGSYRRTLE